MHNSRVGRLLRRSAGEGSEPGATNPVASEFRYEGATAVAIGQPAGASLAAGDAAGVTADGPALGPAREAAGSYTAAPTPAWAQRTGDFLCTALLPLACAALLGCVGVTLANVILRYFFRSDLTSATDWQTLLFAWLAFLGMPRAQWVGRMPSLGATGLFKGRVREALEAVGIGATLAFIALIVWSYFAAFQTQTTSELATLGIPMWVETVSIAVGFILMGVVVLLRYAGCLRQPVWVVGAAVGVAGIWGLIATSVLSSELSLLVGALALLLLNAPIAVAVGVGGAAMFIQGDFTQISLPANQLLEPLRNVALLAIPLFLFMGATVATSDLSARLSRFVKAVLGWLPGGIGVACIGTSALFANLTGSSSADTAAVGTVYIPEMIKGGYSRERAAALQAAGGVVGVVFPPAIAMILYSTVANTDVIKMFEAVIVPGVMLVLMMMALTVVTSLRLARQGQGTPQTRFTWSELARSIPGAIPVLLIPAVLDGGILSGVFTPAESGAAAIVVALGLGFALRSLRLRALWEAVGHTVDLSAMIILILAASSVLNYGITTSGVQDQVNNVLSAAGHSHLLFLLIVNAIFIVVHEFLDIAPSILVIVPLVIPGALLVGVDPVQLGVVIAVNSTIGAVMPPIGLNLYVAGQLANVSPLKMMRPIFVYIMGSVVILALVTVIPELSTWLPSILGR